MGELKDVLAPAPSSTNRAKSHWKVKKPTSVTLASMACRSAMMLRGAAWSTAESNTCL